MRIRITSIVTTMVMFGALLMAFSPAALAEEIPETGCQPGQSGHGNSSVSGWQLMTADDLAQLWVDEFGAPADVNGVPIDPVRAAAQATFDFCDKNDDGFACVLTKKQTGKNYHSGGWLALDNHYPHN
ncbi:MAG: hypothetical protein WBM90_12705 [Acidimicrobiia bacterium]